MVSSCKACNFCLLRKIICIVAYVSDLVPREAVEKWLKYLREELPTVAFKCSTQQQRSNLGWKSSSKAAKPSNILQTSDCLGAETLIKLLKNYSRSHEVRLSNVFWDFPYISCSEASEDFSWECVWYRDHFLILYRINLFYALGQAFVLKSIVTEKLYVMQSSWTWMLSTKKII